MHSEHYASNFEPYYMKRWEKIWRMSSGKATFPQDRSLQCQLSNCNVLQCLLRLFFESFTLNGFQVFNKTGSMKQPLHFSFTWPVVWISWYFKCQSKLRLIALQTTTKATNFPESSLFAFCTYQLPWWSYETNLTRLVVEEMSSIITHHALRAKRFPQHFVSYLI